MQKFQNLFKESEFNNEHIIFECTSLVKYDDTPIGECGIFLTDNYILLINEGISKIIYYHTIHNIDKKDQVISRKLILCIPIENTKFELDFNFDLDRQMFLKNLHTILSNKKHEITSYIELAKVTDIPKGYLPYEELKILRQLYDLGLITDDEYLTTKRNLLRDYL